jgi:hypothetical protein
MEAIMRRLEFKDFAPFTGQPFRFNRDWDSTNIDTQLVLTVVRQYELHKRDRRASDTSGKYRSAPFSVFFEGSHPAPLPQGIYRVTHAGDAEPMEIFITCRGPNEENTAFEYEAVFG